MSLARSAAAPRGQLWWASLTPGARLRFSLGAVVLLALALRLLRLGFQPLWWDEGWSVYFAKTTLGSMARLTAVDIHPPLYYALLHFWIALFGASPLALRLLSVLAGTAAFCTTAEATASSDSAMNTQATVVTNSERAPTLKVCGMVASPGQRCRAALSGIVGSTL